MIIQQGGGGGGSIHRGKFELFGAGGAQIPRIVFAFPETNPPLRFVSGIISRNSVEDRYEVRIEGGKPTFEVQPPHSSLALDNGKPVIIFDLSVAQNTTGEFKIDKAVLKDLPPDLAEIYKTTAEYAVTFRGQEVTTFEAYGFTLSWENTRNEDAYVGVILGYQLRQGTEGEEDEILKLGTLTGPVIKPVFRFYFYVVAATPSKPDPEDLENHRGETAWSPARLTIDLKKFKLPYQPHFPFGDPANPAKWNFYHHSLRKDHHPDHRFIVNLVPNGQWNDNNARSVFTVRVPTAGTQPGLLLGRYFLGIVQP
ncbi:MAG: hypothetical protein ACOYNY_08310 [Caldilineaceae bacterium]